MIGGGRLGCALPLESPGRGRTPPRHKAEPRTMRTGLWWLFMGAALLLGGCVEETTELTACVDLIHSGLRKVADDRTQRFLGKAQEETARCRGGQRAVRFHSLLWVDWQNYWATGDGASKGPYYLRWLGPFSPDGHGINGALLDLEYQRIELIKFNLFDNSGT